MGKSILIKPLNIIILISDNFIDNYMHRRLFESLDIGRKYMEFSTPVEAINYLKLVNDLYDKSGDNSIDLIVFDMNSSKMGVSEFIKQAEITCDLQSKTKLIIISEVFNADESKQLSSNDLVSGVILKPIDYNKIIECFKTIPAFVLDNSGISES